MSRTKKVPFAPWESTKQSGIEERYIRLGNSQMLHGSFTNLNATAFRIYIYMKLESGGRPEFEFPHSKYRAFVSKGGFQKALKELVDAGFVEISEKNANLRKPNLYRFSERWKNGF